MYEGLIFIGGNEYEAIQFENKVSKKIKKPIERTIYDVDVFEDYKGLYIREVK